MERHCRRQRQNPGLPPKEEKKKLLQKERKLVGLQKE